MDIVISRLIPVTAIVPTSNRSIVLKRTLESIALQNVQPEEMIIVDASDNADTETLCSQKFDGLRTVISYQKAKQKGAAVQRNQAIASAKTNVIFFFDDDIRFEKDCIGKLWDCLHSDSKIGAVNAMITNQQYHTPGKVTRFMYRLMSGRNLPTYAGKCIGPAWNLLPEDKPELPEYNEVEWLNTTCTMYKKEALPTPVFPSLFEGYSLMEDLALSLEIGKKWKLYNARNARIFHDSQPGSHKNNVRMIAKMELVNRHYIMTKILQRTKISDYFKLFVFETFGITIVLNTKTGWKNFFPSMAGKFLAIASILTHSQKNAAAIH